MVQVLWPLVMMMLAMAVFVLSQSVSNACRRSARESWFDARSNRLDISRTKPWRADR